MANIEAIAEELVNLTVKEVKELGDLLKEKYGIEPAAAAVAVAAPAAGGAAAAEEKTSFDVILKGVPDMTKKLAVVKAVKDMASLGLKESKELVDNAPDVDWWEFVAFRQPKGKNLRVIFDRYRFETSKMAFMQLENEEEPDIIGLRVALPDLPKDYKPRPDSEADDDRLVGVYVTLEALLGEFDCTTLIGYVDLCPMPKEPFKSGFRPLDDLPEFVEWFKRKVNKD